MESTVPSTDSRIKIKLKPKIAATKPIPKLLVPIAVATVKPVLPAPNVVLALKQIPSVPKITATLNPVPKLIPAPAPDVDDEDLLGFPLYDLRKHAGLSEGSCNEKILELLDSLISLATKQKASSSGTEKTQNARRIASFIKARDAIKDFKGEIKSGAQAQRDIPSVGKGIAQRITEYLKTGTLAELAVETDPETQIILDLCTVTGIGEERAKALLKLGVTSVKDLREKYEKGIIKVTKNQLTHHMAVGLKYYDDIKERMPWSEADSITKLLHKVISTVDPKLIVSVCGSYRRMKPTCGDIDVLITHPDCIEEDLLQVKSSLPEIVKKLSKSNILVGDLTADGKTKYMGICKLDAEDPLCVGRRIDIRFVTYSSYGAAMLYFTGSGKFNKIMRYYANQRGYTLNEYGLFHYINGVKGEQVHTYTENDIFRILNFVYLTPEERDF